MKDLFISQGEYFPGQLVVGKRKRCVAALIVHIAGDDRPDAGHILGFPGDAEAALNAVQRHGNDLTGIGWSGNKAGIHIDGEALMLIGSRTENDRLVNGKDRLRVQRSCRHDECQQESAQGTDRGKRHKVKE